jgi:hypothetical protein
MTNIAQARAIDIFPAKLVLDFTSDEPRVVGKVRARLNDNWLLVWQEQNTFPHTAALIVDTSIREIPINTIGVSSVVRRKQQLAVVTAGGQWLSISPQPGCGCGSRLKSLSNAQLNRQAYQPVLPPQEVPPDPPLPDAILKNWPEL